MGMDSAHEQAAPQPSAPPSLPSMGAGLSDETIQSLKELAAILDRIERRLEKEGYVIERDRIFKPTAEV